MWGGINFLSVKVRKSSKTENLGLASELFVDNHMVIPSRKNAFFQFLQGILIVKKKFFFNVFSSLSLNCFE